MSLPGVSTVIPTHNSARWLPAMLDSVLDQDYASELLEVIVVDDGSSDGTAELAERVLAAGRLAYRVFRSQHAGPSRARNQGWRAARHPWVQFCDSDDLLARDKTRIQAEVASRAPAEVGIVYSPWQRCDESLPVAAPIGPIHAPDLGSDPLVNLVRADCFLAIGCQLFAKPWLERVGGFDDRLRLIEDVQMAIRLVAAGARHRLAPSDHPTYFYRQHASSLSHGDADAFIEACLRNVQLVEEEALHQGGVDRQRARVIAEVWFQAARHYAGRDWTRFEACVKRLETLAPDFVPPAPAHLKLATELVGYRRAERLAVAYRGLKAIFR